MSATCFNRHCFFRENRKEDVPKLAHPLLYHTFRELSIEKFCHSFMHTEKDVPLLHNANETENTDVVLHSVAACLGGGSLYVLRYGEGR